MTAYRTTRVRVAGHAGATRLRRPSQMSSIRPGGSLEVGGQTVATADRPVEAATGAERRWTRGRIARWTVGLLGLFVFVVVGWAAFLLIRLQTTIYKPLPPTPTSRVVMTSVKPAVASITTAGPQPGAQEPTPDILRVLPPGKFNILVLGTDKRPNDPDHYARSDTLLLANVDTISRTVRVMSIPRDLIVDVPDYGKNKVNSAFFFGEYDHLDGGGHALALRTISQFFNVPINYYVTVNFQGFQKIVDTVGGVDIDVPYSIDDFNYPSDDTGDLFGETHVHLDAGWQHMDGKTALRYARTRHADNDFARSKRQLQIIMAVRQKAMSLDLLPSIPSLIGDLGGMVETNIPLDQQVALVQLGYGITASNILTSSIDSSMITPATLPDGSEGLKLNAKAAQPMLDNFFGWNQAGSGSDTSREFEAKPMARTATGPGSTALPTRVPLSHRP